MERLDVHSTLLDGVLQREVYVVCGMIVLLVGGRSLPPGRLPPPFALAPLLRWFGGAVL